MRERRLTLRLTQLEVVGRLQRRGNQTTNRALSAMENGRGLDLGLLPELAESLDCTVTYLLGLSTDPHAWRPDRWARTMETPPAPKEEPVAERLGAPAVRGAVGVLGPEVPLGFSAPGRTRHRGPALAEDSGDR
jgi:transcriptional regulator with XRE-family HTH domain